MKSLVQAAQMLREFRREREGAAAAEFAIVLPLLLILLFAGFEIGRVLHDYHTVVKSVRDAGRYAARFPAGCDDGINGTVLERTRYLALTGRPQEPENDGDYLLAQWTDPETIDVSLVCVDNSDGTFSGLYADRSEVPTVHIEATAPVTLLFSGILGLAPELEFTLTHQQVHVGE